MHLYSRSTWIHIKVIIVHSSVQHWITRMWYFLRIHHSGSPHIQLQAHAAVQQSSLLDCVMPYYLFIIVLGKLSIPVIALRINRWSLRLLPAASVTKDATAARLSLEAVWITHFQGQGTVIPTHTYTHRVFFAPSFSFWSHRVDKKKDKICPHSIQ